MGVGALTDDFRMLSMESWSQGELGRARESQGESRGEPWRGLDSLVSAEGWTGNRRSQGCPWPTDTRSPGRRSSSLPGRRGSKCKFQTSMVMGDGPWTMDHHSISSTV